MDVQDTCVCRSSTAIGQAPESITAFHFRPSGVYQAAWTAPVNSKLLFDAGGGVIISSFVNYRAPGVLPERRVDSRAVHGHALQRRGDL